MGGVVPTIFTLSRKLINFKKRELIHIFLTMGSDNAKANSYSLRYPIILYTLVAVIYMIQLRGKGLDWFSWHPTCMFVSFVAFAANAILIKKAGGKQNTLMHGYIMGSTVLLAGFGYYVIYINKEISKRPHLTTSHGITFL